MPGTSSDLANVAIARLGSKYLIQITNDSPTATSIDTARLTAACEDTIGEFRMITGIEYEDTYTFNSICIHGVMYYLELYKSREGQHVEMHSKKFYSKCKSLRDLGVISASSSSTLEPSTETSGNLPDMDRSKNIWKTFPNTTTIGQISTSGDY